MINRSLFTAAILGASLMTGCVSTREQFDQGYCAPDISGTDTKVIKITLDGDGMPVVAESHVVIEPGAYAVFVGPPEFAIRIKTAAVGLDRDYRTQDASISLLIPEDFIERNPKLLAAQQNGDGGITIEYGVIVGDKELDPELHVRPD